jgi:hypothetical protein
MCSPQNSAICSNVSAVLSTSHDAVAWGISGKVGWLLTQKLHEQKA